MDANKHIDQFVKQKLEKRKFEYQDSFWETAEQMIVANENRRRKKRGFFFLFLGVMICLAGSGIWFQAKELTRSYTKLATNNTEKNTLHNHENILLAHVELASVDESIATSDLKLDFNQEKAQPENRLLGVSTFNTQLNSHSTNSPNLLRKEDNESFSNITTAIVVEESKERVESPEILISPIDLEANLELGVSSPPPTIQKMDISFKKHHWHVVLGGQFFNRIATQNTTLPSRKIDPLFGVIYERALNPKLSVNAGLLYQPRSGLNVIQSVTSKDYGFGVETITTQFSAQNIHYIALPLQLRMKLRGNHSALLGVNYASIFQVSGKKFIKTENSLGGGGQTKENIHAMIHNFESSDLSLRAGYEYHIYHRTFLGVQANYGLKNIYKQEVGLKEKNLSLQFYVRYHLFRH